MNEQQENAAFLTAINNGGGRVAELVYADWLDERGRHDEAELIRADRQDSFVPAIAQVMRARWDGGDGGYGGYGGYGGDGGYGGFGGDGGDGDDGGFGGFGGYGGDGGFGGD